MYDGAGVNGRIFFRVRFLKQWEKIKQKIRLFFGNPLEFFFNCFLSFSRKSSGFLLPFTPAQSFAGASKSCIYHVMCGDVNLANVSFHVDLIFKPLFYES